MLRPELMSGEVMQITICASHSSVSTMKVAFMAVTLLAGISIDVQAAENNSVATNQRASNQANLTTATSQPKLFDLLLPSYAQWQRDVSQVMVPAIGWLEQRKAQGGEKLAIVLDIDNTAVETSYGFGRANQPVLKVAKWAKANGYSTLFVTSRRGSSFTQMQLRSNGYVIDGICGRNDGSKEECRWAFEDMGFTITANIGNRDGDFTGGFYEKAFKLPDYNGLLF